MLTCVWTGCCLVTSSQCSQIHELQICFSFSQLWNFFKNEELFSTIILFQLRLPWQSQNLLSPNPLNSMCFPAFVSLLTSSGSRGAGELWPLADTGRSLPGVPCPRNPSSLPAGHSAWQVLGGHGCPVVRHCSLNPCVLPWKGVGISEKIMTDEI